MHPIPLLVSAIAGAMALSLSAQDVVHVWRGEPGDGFGTSLAALGDTDLDGSVDFAVGAPDRNGGAGAVDVFSSRSGARLRVLPGMLAGDRFGLEVRSAGDLDRDGFQDLWVLSSSTLFAFSGRDGSPLWRFAAPVHFAAMADYDGDGHADLALVNEVGEVLVRSGRDGGVLTKLSAGKLPIARFAVCGDVDGDGSPDVMTTRVDNASRFVDVWSLRTGLSLFQAMRPVPGFGDQIGAAGDVDRDGFADFFVFDSEPLAPPPMSDNGITRVYSGATLTELLRDTGVIWCDRGTCVRVLRHEGYAASPADVDGDGMAERFLRQELWDGEQVSVRKGDQTLLRLPGTQVVPAGDADRDGAGDYLAVARPGEVWLLSAARTARQRYGVATFGDRAYGSDACGDADGDGYGDYFVSRAFPGSVTSMPSASVALHSGRDGSLLWSYVRNPTLGMMRIVLAAGGDIDRDGSTDVAITGYGYREIRVYGSVRATEPFLVLSDAAATGALAVGADWTGDGTTDLFCASATTIELRSGATGAVVWTLPLGAVDLRLVGDVDADGVADLLADDRLVGSATRTVVRKLPSLPVAFVGDENGDHLADAWTVDGERLVLVSGIDGVELRSLPAPAGGAVVALAAAADWNGDGWLDLVAGQPDCEGVGRVAVVSGLEGRLLHTEWGEAAGDAFGTRVGALALGPARDADPALVATAVRGGLSNSGYGRWAQQRVHPAAVHVHGISCGSAGVRPALQWSGGAPRIGGTFSLQAVGIASNGAAIFLYGLSEDTFGALALPLNLRTVGMPGCVLHVAVDLHVPVLASSSGRASMQVRIPEVPAILGVRLFGQTLVSEPTANRLGLLASDAARIVVGR